MKASLIYTIIRGVEILYDTAEKEIGEDALNQYIKHFYQTSIHSDKTYSAFDWYQGLEKQVPENQRKRIHSKYTKVN